MKVSLSRSRLPQARTAFTFVEALIVVAIIGVLVAAWAIPQISTTRKVVSDTKLSTDVARLNSLIAVYVASGGSVDGATTPQAVLDRLKTKRTTADANRTVFPMTGRAVDTRLGVRMQSPAEAARVNEPRAVWNATTKRFDIAYTGAAGIADFIVNDALDKDYGTETRTQTSVRYNGNNNGWVWESGSGAGPASMTPADATLGAPSTSPFNPSGGGTSVTAPLTGLPVPSIAPGSGSFLAAAFPTTATISSNGAPAIGSRISYMIIHADNTYTAWATYSTAIPLIFGDTVISFNQTTLPLLYVDSPQVKQTYIRTVGTLPAPIITPNGGQFASSATLPTSATIAANGAPGGTWSKLKYRITSITGVVGAWTNYASAISLTLGDTLEAKNFSLDTTSYNDSPSDSETYTALVAKLPNPLISPNGGGFNGVTFPASVTIDANGAPAGKYTLKYMINHSDGSVKNWTTYTSGSITLKYGDVVTAQNLSNDTDWYMDSDQDVESFILSDIIKLPPPILTQVTISGKKYISIAADTNAGITIPAGAYIQYTINGVDPGNRSDETPATGTKYDPNHPIPVPTNLAEFVVTARLYPPNNNTAKLAYDTSDPTDIDIDLPAAASPGLAAGHIDVDTSHMLYPFNQGRTDAHQHAYDDKYNTTGVNMMGFGDGSGAKVNLVNMQVQIPAGVRFKIIISNANLSTGGRLVINKDYNANDVGTYVGVSAYDDTAVASLPIYTTNGILGTTKLEKLSVQFEASALSAGGVVPTSTGKVKGNVPGTGGIWRNGALTIQAVKVNSDMTDGFTTNTSYSNGGVQGTATSGLLWECTIFWHKPGA